MRDLRLIIFCVGLLPLIRFTNVTRAATNDYYAIQIVDDQTGRGVPLVELRLVNKAAWWTDSNGIIAFHEPGLMDIDVYFHISSPGYEYPKDLFNHRGVKLKPKDGSGATIKIKRLNIAERLYRITGAGIYRDSVLVGRPIPLKHPVLNGQVMGQDTVIATVYRGKIYWFWGDTDRASYPLGNFGASGATSELPGQGGLEPSTGIDLNYFVDASGFSKPMCPLPGQQGLRWIEGLLTVPDERGQECLVARVANMRGLDAAHDWHLMVFNDKKESFESIQSWDIRDGHESAHPVRARVNGQDFSYIFSNYRVRNNLENLRALTHYAAFTCLAGDGKWRGEDTLLDRDGSGRLRFAWKPGADRLRADRVNELVDSGKLKPEECWTRLIDFESGKWLTRGISSVAWNEYRQRWIGFFADKPGEVWFAEADTPTGPWGYARQIVTHGEYNFYNTAHHPFFDEDGGRMVYFEGTYTAAFSGAKQLTPRYDYNQIMYRVALDDPRLALPVAVYRFEETNGTTHMAPRSEVETLGAWERIKDIGWFALPPTVRRPGLAPVYATETKGAMLSITPPVANARPLFLGLPLDDPEPGAVLDGAWAFHFVQEDGGELNASLRLTLKGEDVMLDGLGPDMVSSGIFRDGKLTLSLKDADGTFFIEGQLRDQSLAGTWRKMNSAQHGAWSASRQETDPRERSSPAIVVLREYRRTADGSTLYSTEGKPPPGCDPNARPLGRVWKVPTVVLALDWRAKPYRSDISR